MGFSKTELNAVKENAKDDIKMKDFADKLNKVNTDTRTVIYETTKNPTESNIKQAKDLIKKDNQLNINEKESLINALMNEIDLLKKSIEKYTIRLLTSEELLAPELLNVEIINNEIRQIDINNARNLILKCQRLYVICEFNLYKKLGYSSRDEYAKKEHNIERTQLHKYTKIWKTLQYQLNNLFEIYFIENNVESTEQNVESTEQNVTTSNIYKNFTIEKLFEITKLEEKEKIDHWIANLQEQEYSIRKLRQSISVNQEKSYTNLELVKKIIKKFNRTLPEKIKEPEKILLKEFAENILKLIKE